MRSHVLTVLKCESSGFAGLDLGDTRLTTRKYCGKPVD